MAKIAQTATMYLIDDLYGGPEWFESKQRGGSDRQAVICGGTLRKYFNLPEKVTELWLIAHDTPTAGGLHVSFRLGDDWVYCNVVDKDMGFPTIEIFDDRMDQYLTKLLRLTEDDVKDVFVTCEYR